VVWLCRCGWVLGLFLNCVLAPAWLTWQFGRHPVLLVSDGTILGLALAPLVPHSSGSPLQLSDPDLDAICPASACTPHPLPWVPHPHLAGLLPACTMPPPTSCTPTRPCRIPLVVGVTLLPGSSFSDRYSSSCCQKGRKLPFWGFPHTLLAADACKSQNYVQGSPDSAHILPHTAW
jgi:hypothetical protein